MRMRQYKDDLLASCLQLLLSLPNELVRHEFQALVPALQVYVTCVYFTNILISLPMSAYEYISSPPLSLPLSVLPSFPHSSLLIHFSLPPSSLSSFFFLFLSLTSPFLPLLSPLLFCLTHFSFLPLLLPSLQTTFKLGLSFLPLANAGLDALEAWNAELPAELLKPHFRHILPYLDDYLKTLSVAGQSQ